MVTSDTVGQGRLGVWEETPPHRSPWMPPAFADPVRAQIAKAREPPSPRLMSIPVFPGRGELSLGLNCVLPLSCQIPMSKS